MYFCRNFHGDPGGIFRIDDTTHFLVWVKDTTRISAWTIGPSYTALYFLSHCVHSCVVVQYTFKFKFFDHNHQLNISAILAKKSIQSSACLLLISLILMKYFKMSSSQTTNSRNVPWTQQRKHPTLMRCLAAVIDRALKFKFFQNKLTLIPSNKIFIEIVLRCLQKEESVASVNNKIRSTVTKTETPNKIFSQSNLDPQCSHLKSISFMEHTDSFSCCYFSFSIECPVRICLSFTVITLGTVQVINLSCMI